ncbi:MAG: YbjQ family protein [Cryomorphaceae bacterium]|nr:YbjQ family protein [Cryomorphaceae bacterium]
MIITNTEKIPGREITEILGVVRGNTVRARNLGRDIFAGLRGLVGGEINEYTELMTESREEAMRRMESEALSLNADAIVNVRFMTSPVMQNAAEILVYGTAVKLTSK